MKQTVIEKNASVIEAAQRFFEFPVDNRLSVINEEAEKIILLSGDGDFYFVPEWIVSEKDTKENFSERINRK